MAARGVTEDSLTEKPEIIAKKFLGEFKSSL
jgi:hypothetical protein